MNLHRRREPRFYTSIAADRCYWRLGTATNNIHLVKTYQGEAWGCVKNDYQLPVRKILWLLSKKMVFFPGNSFSSSAGID